MILTLLDNNVLKHVFADSKDTIRCNAFPNNDALLILTTSKIFLVREFLCQPDWYIQKLQKTGSREKLQSY
jgi:hypothetical protein